MLFPEETLDFQFVEKSVLVKIDFSFNVRYSTTEENYKKMNSFEVIFVWIFLMLLLFQSDENEFCTRTFSIPNKVPVGFDRVSVSRSTRSAHISKVFVLSGLKYSVRIDWLVVLSRLI